MTDSSVSLLRPQSDARKAPLMLCHKLNSAPGSAAVAEKDCMARATPSPEFCMPTSKAIVWLCRKLKPRSRLRKKPPKRPKLLCKITAKRVSPPTLARLSEFRATTIVIIPNMISMDRVGITCSIFLIFFGR